MDVNPVATVIALLGVIALVVSIPVLIGLTIVVFLRRALGYRRPEDAVALGLLKERFARGEIDEAEYERARRIIER